MKKRDIGVALIIFFLILPFNAEADEEVSSFPYVSASEHGPYYIKMIPESATSYKGSGTAYEIKSEGPDEELWSFQGWYSRSTFLSDNGEYLVIVGGWPRGNKPSEEDLAIVFYHQGRLIKSYSTKDLIKDLSKVFPSKSHYVFRKGKPGFLSPYGYSFRLTTIDDIEYIFDVKNGDILEQRSTDDVLLNISAQSSQFYATSNEKDRVITEIKVSTKEVPVSIDSIMIKSVADGIDSVSNVRIFEGSTQVDIKAQRLSFSESFFPQQIYIGRNGISIAPFTEKTLKFVADIPQLKQSRQAASFALALLYMMVEDKIAGGPQVKVEPPTPIISVITITSSDDLPYSEGRADGSIIQIPTSNTSP